MSNEKPTVQVPVHVLADLLETVAYVQGNLSARAEDVDAEIDWLEGARRILKRCLGCEESRND